jgi:hypothetical protein
MEKDIEGFSTVVSKKLKTEGEVDWHIDWYSRSSTYNITYDYEDATYYVRAEYKALTDVDDEHKFKDLDSAVKFVKNNEA